VEFEGFGADMNQSRQFFVEAAQMILRGLETGVVEYDGALVKQVRREIRPRPQASFRGRTYAAAVSPESVRIMAELGVGLLIIPQKPWEVVAAELDTYRSVYHEVNASEAPPPIVSAWVVCDEDEARAREKAYRWIGGYWRTVVEHYELIGDHLAHTRGYESYGRMQEIASAQGGVDALIEFFLGIQVWGTPEQCYEKILNIRRITGTDSFTGIFSFAGMPFDEAEHSMRLFAREVRPRLQALPSASQATRAAAVS
jgi:alkanesulfonate monooxygenase SsuD/methylene tetrahydromethanopterin reductase-like flavin-dependent oxidoreductase (luciferase family)